MRRLALISSLVAGGLLAVSCTGDRERVPTQSPNFSQTAPPANHGQVEELIAKLFPPGDLRQQADDRLQAVQDALVQGDIVTARALAIGPGGLVAFAVRQFAAGALQQVKGVSPDPYLVDLINAIYRFVGLPGPIPESAKGDDGAIAVVGPGGGEVVTGTRHAEINFPAGALNDDVLVIIARLPDSPVPLPTDLDQFPLFYDYATFPDVPKFNVPVTVALCVLDQGPGAPPPDVVPRLRLAHPRRPDRTTIEILPLASQEDYPSLFCGDLASGQAGGGAAPGLAARLASAAFDLFAPPALHAATVVRPGGLGGEADNLSPFGAVDPGKLVFTTQPSSTPAGAAITPPVQVTVERENGSTIASFSGTITVALGNNPGEGTLSGTTTVAPLNGVATFADLSIDNVGTGYTLVATAVSVLGEPPTPATSDRFDITQATSGVITFETYPNGQAVCDNCPLTREYASRGVLFSFASQFTDATNAQLYLSSQVYDPADGPPNHSVTSAATPTGGFWVGVVTMAFGGSPQSVRFQLRGNNEIPVFTVAAVDGSGNPISSSQIARSGVSTYTSVSGFLFRQETVTITSPTGISRVDVDGRPSFILLIDDLLITP